MSNISHFYKVLTQKIENLQKISSGKDNRSKFFNSQVDQFESIFDQFIEKLINQNTINRDISNKLSAENNDLRRQVRKLMDKLDKKDKNNPHRDRYFPFIK